MAPGLAAAQAWPESSPAQAGFREDLGARLDAGVRAGLLRDLHGLVLARHGAIVLERYWPGVDDAWGRPLGTVAFGPETLHDLRSVTKSIVGLLYGIALERGKVAAPEAKLMAQFPEYADLAADPARAGLTVGHALGMTMGTEWDETSVPYTDARNSEIAMEMAPDRLRFVLERPVMGPPGVKWTYSGGAVALIGALIARGTGMALDAFAREALFAPLGIGQSEWAAGRDGVASAASGLRLRARDLARIGVMVLAGGAWDGRQVVPRSWLEAATQGRVPTGEGFDYGWLWYSGEIGAPGMKDPRRWVGGFGNGGQRLWLLPSAGVVLASFSGAYDRPDQWVTPVRVWREIVLANLVRR